MPESESENDPPSAEDSGISAPISSAETDAGWDDLVGDSEELTNPVTAAPAPKAPTPARRPAGLFTPSMPGGPKLPPLPGIPAAPPVPGIKPAPLFTPVSLERSSDADKPDDAGDAEGEDDEDAIEAEVEEEEEADDTATERTPVRLPTPGVWGKQAPHDAVIDFVRREDAADFLAKAAASASEDGESSAPKIVPTQDTQALIASMAEEIEEVAEAKKAAEEAERARKAKEAALLEQPTIVYDRSKGQDESGSKTGWIAIAAAALAGVVLIGWSIAGGGDEASEIEASEPSAAVAAAERPSSTQPAEPVAEAMPMPVPVPVPTEIEDGETGEAAETGAEEPLEAAEEAGAEQPPAEALENTEPVPSGPTKQGRGSKSKKKGGSSGDTQTTSTPAGKGPKPADKPAPPSGKSASDLLRDARKANAAGQSSKAYSLANESYQKKASSDAAEVMVIAACKMKNTGKARTALNRVKLLKRRDLKQRCKSMGVDI